MNILCFTILLCNGNLKEDTNKKDDKQDIDEDRSVIRMAFG
jgi:hypothetical protein